MYRSDCLNKERLNKKYKVNCYVLNVYMYIVYQSKFINTGFQSD